MSDLFPVTLDEMIACAKRELAMRERVYPRRVADGKMKQPAADREIRTMTAILHALMAIKDGCAQQPTTEETMAALGVFRGAMEKAGFR